MGCKGLLLPCALVLVAMIPLGTAGQCPSMRDLNISLPDSSNLKCGHVCPREHGWKMLPVLWAPLEVEINCSSSSFTVLTGHSQEQLVSEGSPIKWCGWHQVLKDPRVCRFKLSPLQTQYLAVDEGKNGGLLPGSSAFTCVVDSTQELSVRDMVLTIVGVLLFFNAGRLTMNEYFRLTSGSLMFMSGAVVVLAFILMRSMPYKRSLAAIFTVSGTSLLAVVRWLYGTWLPDAHTLIFSRPFAIYMAVTAVLGWSVTYWLDDVNNVKLNNTIRVTLQMAGLLMVYLGISDERVAVTAAVVLVFSRVLLAIGRRLGLLLWWVTKALGAVLQLACNTASFLLSNLVHGAWQLLGLSWQAVCSAFTSLHSALTSRLLPRVPSRHTITRAATGTSAAAGRVLRDAAAPDLAAAGAAVLPEDAEPLLSDEEGEVTAQRGKSSRAQRPGRPRTRPQRAAAAEDRLLSSDEEPEMTPIKPEPNWSPLHFKNPPPLSPLVLAQQARQAATGLGSWFGASAAAAAADRPDVAYRFPSSTPPAAPARSPWSQEKVAVDINRRVESPNTTGAAPAKLPWSNEKVAFDDSRRRPAPAAAVVSPVVQQQQQQQSQAAVVSPLVAAGRIINPDTGRPIAMNKSKYNELLAQGYMPDLQNGVLIAPEGRVSPAAALRKRRSGMTTPR